LYCKEKQQYNRYTIGKKLIAGKIFFSQSIILKTCFG